MLRPLTRRPTPSDVRSSQNIRGRAVPRAAGEAGRGRRSSSAAAAAATSAAAGRGSPQPCGRQWISPEASRPHGLRQHSPTAVQGPEARHRPHAEAVHAETQGDRPTTAAESRDAGGGRQAPAGQATRCCRGRARAQVDAGDAARKIEIRPYPGRPPHPRRRHDQQGAGQPGGSSPWPWRRAPALCAATTRTACCSP